MRRGWAITIASLAIFGLAGCYGYQLNEANSLQPQGSTFDKALFKQYSAESKSEYEQGNYQSSDLWAKTATVAAHGQTPKPTQVTDWQLPSAVQPEMTTARSRLQVALDKGGGNVAPDDMAAAQMGWDCWAEQQRVQENFQPSDIANCKKKYYYHIAKVEAALTPKAPPPMPKAEAPKDFLVFFDWNMATLTPEARKIIADVAAQIKAQNAKQVKVVGFTDRSGSPQYNLRLSVRRADSVKSELVHLGVPAGIIATEGRGEEDPLVPTADGVREAQNRRASINIVRSMASLDGKDGQVLVQIGTLN